MNNPIRKILDVDWKTCNIYKKFKRQRYTKQYTHKIMKLIQKKKTEKKTLNIKNNYIFTEMKQTR